MAKIEVDKVIYEIPKDEEISTSKIYRMSVNFLIRGKILALPKYQKDIYSDEEVFGKKIPESIKILSDDEDYLKTFDNGIGAGIVFKHPCFHYGDETLYWLFYRRNSQLLHIIVLSSQHQHLIATD